MDKHHAPVYHGQAASAARFFDQLHRYKRLLFTYWWIVLTALILSVGIRWVLIQRAPPSFVSVGRMILGVKLSIPNANFYTEELNNFFGTQVELMQSDSVINRVNLRLRKSVGLHPVPVDIRASLSPKTSIFDLRAVGSDPDYVQAYLQATMDEYVKLKRELLESASTTTKDSLQEERKRLAVELAISKDALLDYQSLNSVVFLQQSGGNNAADYLASLTRQLTERKAELQLLKTLTLDENLERQESVFSQPSPASQSYSQSSGRQQNPSQSYDAAPPQNSVSSQLNSDAGKANTRPNGLAGKTPNTPGTLGGFETAYLQAKQQIVLLKAKRDDLSEFLRPRHPDIIALDDEIASQTKLLEILQEQSLEHLKNHQHSLAEEIKSMENQITEWERKAVEASKKLSDYEALKENSKRLQTMYDQLEATLQTLDVDKGIGQESVSIFEPATPGVPAPRKLARHLAIAGCVGLTLGMAILLLLNQLDDRPNSLTELEGLFQEPLLGQIPLVKSGTPILQPDDDRHTLVEAFNNLRSALIFKDSPNHEAKSIVITSAVPNDGKSTVSINLAITLAEGGARVLLLDADLRCGKMHELFSLPGQPGLAEVLAEQCAWSDAVVHTAIPNLDVLPCGAPPRRPASLFVTGTEKLLKAMAGHYDYYLFDTAPVMAADDVSSLAPYVGSLIMVVRAGATRGRIAKTALNLLNLRKINVIGLVFNAVTANASNYHYYQYKEYFPQSTTK